MEPSRPIDSSSASDLSLTTEQQRQLLAIARASIMHRLDCQYSAADITGFEPSLNRPTACFVTLRLKSATPDGETLRGCIGTLEAQRPLTEAVAYFSEQAACHDPRFDPLSLGELDQVEIEISLLSPLTPLPVTSQAQLLQRLRPGIDGLWLEAGSKRATYLPQVWQQLPTAQRFVASLKCKAGLQPDSWDDDFSWSTYRVQHFSESDC